MGKQIETVTIVGGGTAGWMAALLLQSRCLGNKERQMGVKRITLIESPNVPTVGVGEATVPGMSRTLSTCGIPERAFFKTCNASFKLGVLFDNWNVGPDGKPVSYINPFARAPVLEGVDTGVYFNNLGAGNLDYVQTFAATVDLMRACKGPRPLGAKEFDLQVPFAYHLDAGRFARMLRDICVARGVVHISDDVVDVEKDEKGYIAALQLKETGRFPVELVIDCTGFRGLIINQALDEPFISYSKYLANDKAMAVQVPHPDPTRIEPVTRSTALGAGWSWRVPLYNRIGTGYVFSSAHRTDDEARDEFLAHLGPMGKDAEPRIIPMRVGRNRNAWVKNCISIGLSGGFIEPLESTAIHMIDTGIRWLINYFPDSDYPDPLRKRYNKLVDQLYNEVRDFICLHYRRETGPTANTGSTRGPSWRCPTRWPKTWSCGSTCCPASMICRFDAVHARHLHAVLLGKRVYETGFGEGKINNGLALDLRGWQGYLQNCESTSISW